MIQIPRQQILNRYDTLPESLKDAGFLPYNTLLIKKIGESNHLTGEKISTVSHLVGYVLFGFIHAEDLAEEIKNELNIAPEIANPIADEIDRKIFSLVRADLEKVYQPPTEEEILDLRPAAREVKPTEEAVLPAAEAPMTEVGAAAAGPVEAPKILPQEEKPEEEFSEVKLPKIQPGETESPFIIHKEVEFKPLSENKKSLGGLFGFLRKGGEEKLQRTEPVRAQVEIGDKSLKTEPSKITKTAEMPKVRVVHYTEFQPAASPFPEAADQRGQEREPTKTNVQTEAEKFPRESAPAPLDSVVSNEVNQRESTLGEIKPPALDLRQTPAEIKPVSEKKAPTLAEGEVKVPPAKRVEEEEKMIDLSTFK